MHGTRNRKGFTLIELLLVVAVLMLIPMLSGCQEKEIETRREIDVDTKTVIHRETVVE